MLKTHHLPSRRRATGVMRGGGLSRGGWTSRARRDLLSSVRVWLGLPKACPRRAKAGVGRGAGPGTHSSIAYLRRRSSSDVPLSFPSPPWRRPGRAHPRQPSRWRDDEGGPPAFLDSSMHAKARVESTCDEQRSRHLCLQGTDRTSTPDRPGADVLTQFEK